MSLAADYLHHPDIAKAARELLGNIERLRLAGYFEAAFELACLLAHPGPWACPPKGLNYQRVLHQLPALAWLVRRACPALAGQRGRDVAELDRWAHSTQSDAFARVVTTDRLQMRPAGIEWTRAWLDALPESEQRDGNRASIGRYMDDLDWVLKCRVREALDVEPPELMPAVVRALVPLRTAAPILVAPQTHAFDHGYLLDVLLACVEATGGAGYLAERSLMLAVALDLHAGARAAAVARLARWSAWLIDDAAIDWPLRLWPPYVEVLRSHALGAALGLDDDAVTDYVERCAQRGATRQDVAPQAGVDWPAVLADFCTRKQKKLSDPTLADDLAGLLDHRRPVSRGLQERARRGEFTAPGLDARALLALETRLGLRLPPSYRAFLVATDGLYAGSGPSLLPAADVDWMHHLDPAAVESWIANIGHEATDAQYALYGSAQDCIHMRTRHLRRALQVSTERDGDVLLLIPGVRFGAEWEAWFLGAKNPGAYRYRSFDEMFRAVLLR